LTTSKPLLPTFPHITSLGLQIVRCTFWDFNPWHMPVLQEVHERLEFPGGWQFPKQTKVVIFECRPRFQKWLCLIHNGTPFLSLPPTCGSFFSQYSFAQIFSPPFPTPPPLCRFFSFCEFSSQERTPDEFFCFSFPFDLTGRRLIPPRFSFEFFPNYACQTQIHSSLQMSN